MKITNVTAYAIKIPRELDASRGTAGSPAPLQAGESGYRFAATYQTLYSTRIETAIIKIDTDAGLTGWGEAQSPVAPEVVVTIVRTILAPILIGEEALAHERLWSRMYNAMRVRGHTGSFLLDAIAGIDTALWDLKGKACRTRLCELLGGPFSENLPVYISGLSGGTEDARIAQASDYQQRGFQAFKIFMDGEPDTALRLLHGLRDRLGPQTGLMLDALWRLDVASAIRLGRELDQASARWLEAPLKPEDVRGHAKIAAALETPVAIGECYRTRWEVQPFFAAQAVEVLQPDIGRTGISEGLKLAAQAELHQVAIAFHVSIGLGIQIAAALHVAAAIPNLMFVECNPQVWQVADLFLRTTLPVGDGVVGLPAGPGLGIEIDEEKLQPFITN